MTTIRRALFLAALLMMALTSHLCAQETTVTGTVTDAESNETLPGVNIVVQGTTVGTSTDAEGSYSLTVPSLSDTLIFTFIGYERQISILLID